MIVKKFAAAAFLAAVLILIVFLLCLRLPPAMISEKQVFPIDVKTGITDFTLTDSLDWEKFPSVVFVFRSQKDAEIEIWRQSSELKINITLPDFEDNPLDMRMKGEIDRTIAETLEVVKNDFDAKYIPATLISSELFDEGKSYLRTIQKSGLDFTDVQAFQRINEACEEVGGQKPVFELEWTFYFIVKAKTGDLTYEKIFPVRYSFTNAKTDSRLHGNDLGFEANISDTEVNLSDYLGRGCFPAVTIRLRTDRDGVLEVWKEPSWLEYPKSPFDSDEWSSNLIVMRTVLTMRELIRKTKDEFADKYGRRKLVYTAPVQEGKEYLFIVEKPDIQMFRRYRMNITDDACSKTRLTIPGITGWEWRFTYTFKVVSDGLKKEKVLSVRYGW